MNNTTTSPQTPTRDSVTSSDLLGISVGDVLTFDVLEWYHEGYEFGRPCLMLAPVIRENSDSNPESLIEDALLDAVLDGHLRRNNEQQQIEWRGWNLGYLRRCFNAALHGKRTPKANYTATRKTVKIVRDKDGELTWVDMPNAPLELQAERKEKL